jgi:hypothetical protein
MSTATQERNGSPETQAAWAASLSSSEVRVGTPGANGGLWVGPAGTALPTDCKTAFATPWLPLGYISDAGPTIGQNASQTDLTPWQSIAPVRSVLTQRQVTLHFILWQLNVQSLGIYFDTDQPVPSVTDGSFTMPVRADKGGHVYAFAVDALDGNNVLRIGMTRATLTDAGDMALTRGSTVPMECTLTAQVDNNVLCTVMSGPAS